MITAQQVKELRDMTGISMMECKKALEEARKTPTEKYISHEEVKKRILKK